MTDQPNQPIPLDSSVPEPTGPQPIALDGNTNAYLLDPNYVASRAFKASYGLNGTAAAVPQNTATSAISSGQEQPLREGAASTLNQDISNQKQDATVQLAQKPGPLTTDDFNWLKSSPKFNTYFDPKSVFEVNYSNAYTQELDKFSAQAGDANAWNILKQFPGTSSGDPYSAVSQFGTQGMAFHEYVLNRLQNTQSKMNAQSNAGYAADFVKMAFPIFNPYYELKMRSNVPGVSFFDGLLGGNLEDQRNKLLDMPMQQRFQVFDTIMDKLDRDNPQAAAAFGASMLGQTSKEYLLNQINTIGNLSDIPAVLKIGMVPFRAASVINQARKAAMDINLSNAISPEMTRTNILASVGDTRNAAINQAAEKLSNIIKGSTNVTEDALNSLPRYMRTDVANIKADPGNLTTTEVNAIMEQYKASESKILSTLATALRPGATVPLENLSREAMDALADATISRYPGMKNAVIGRSDPFLEPISDRLMVTYRIGKNAGEAFESEDRAIQYARFHDMPIKYSPDQIANIKVRLDDIKEQIKAGPEMDADTAGLNHYYGLDKQLKDLETQYAEATKNTTGSRIGKLEGGSPPPVKEGYVRFYHGGDNPTSGGGRWVSQDLNYATNYRQGQSVHYIDIPEKSNVLPNKAFDDTGTGQKAPYVNFELPEEYAKELKPYHSSVEGIKVNQQGAGYYIEVTKPVDYTSNAMRSIIYDPKRPGSQTPDSISKYVPWLGNYARTPEDTLSAEHNAIRKAAVYPQAKLLELAHDEWKYIQGPASKMFNKQEASDFRDALIHAQNNHDPVTGLPGYYYDTPGQLRDFYQRTFGRDPSFKEQQAYFAVKRWSEYDLALRELALYRNKSRVGAETHTIISKDADDNEVRSNAFDGVTRTNLPSSGNILVMGDTTDASKVRSLKNLWKKSSEVKDIREGLKDGTYRLIEPYDAKEYPFKDFVKDGDKTVDYVLTKRVETSPLTFKQLPQRGGGHFQYPYEHYLKQAKIDREKVDGVTNFRYQGDTTVAGLPYSAFGNDLADKMNEVRMAIKNNKLDYAQAITTKHLPYEWQDLMTKYKTGVFDLDEPFQVVPKNKSVIDMDSSLDKRFGDRLVDDTRQGLARNFQVQFTGKRDAEEFHSVINTGTQADPVYAFRPAEKVDPIETMNRALGGITSSTFMDDYKTYAVESFLREISPYLKEEFSQRARSSPFAVYQTLSDKMFRNGVRPEDVQNFMSNKFKIDQLVGTPSKWDTFLHSIAQDLADTIASKGGTKTAEKLTPAWLLSKTKDPISFMRSVTFDAYLGLGYVPQIFVQMASFVNMFAITPRYSVMGAYGAYLHMLSKVNSNPEILAHLDNLATKMDIPGMPQWRPGEWKEAMESLDRTGFSYVGGEYGPLANLKYAKPVQSGAQTFLNWGRKPFQMGEGATRVGAWYIAFKEFRDKNPTGAVSRGDLQNILARADLLYGNMSHASNSVLHSGILSLPTQFYAYQLRQAEIFWGKRLGDTVAERMAARARLIAVNAAMFGVPMGFGYTGLPAADYLRKEMMQNGFFGYTQPYSPDNAQGSGKGMDWIQHMLMEGMPATMLTLITGNNYNLGPRYGMQGFNQIRDGLMGDSGFLGAVLGPSGSLIANTYKNSWPFIYALRSMVNGDGKLPLVADDFVDIVKQAQTVNKLWGLKAALTTGKLVSGNSGYVMDTSKLNAIGMAVFGLQPQEQVDMHSMQQNAKSQHEEVKWYTNQFTQNWNRGLIAANANDPEQSKKYMAKAIGYLKIGQISTDDIARAMASVSRDRTSMIDNIAWQTLVAHSSENMKIKNQELYSTIHKYLQNRGQ